MCADVVGTGKNAAPREGKRERQRRIAPLEERECSTVCVKVHVCLEVARIGAWTGTGGGGRVQKSTIPPNEARSGFRFEWIKIRGEQRCRFLGGTGAKAHGAGYYTNVRLAFIQLALIRLWQLVLWVAV